MEQSAFTGAGDKLGAVEICAAQGLTQTFGSLDEPGHDSRWLFHRRLPLKLTFHAAIVAAKALRASNNCAPTGCIQGRHEILVLMDNLLDVMKRASEALHLYISITNPAMPNIASVLKNEIARVARKEVRAETQALKKAISAYRAEIAALKRGANALEKKIRQLGKTAAKSVRESVPSEESAATTIRFSATGLAAQRRRLGLSANDCGLLVGASGQSIYKWEAGKARPRAVHLPAIASLKGMSKKDATARLEAMV